MQLTSTPKPTPTKLFGGSQTFLTLSTIIFGRAIQTKTAAALAAESSKESETKTFLRVSSSKTSEGETVLVSSSGDVEKTPHDCSFNFCECLCSCSPVHCGLWPSMPYYQGVLKSLQTGSLLCVSPCLKGWNWGVQSTFEAILIQDDHVFLLGGLAKVPKKKWFSTTGLLGPCWQATTQGHKYDKPAKRNTQVFPWG